MDLLITAIAFLLIFSAIILIHEFGHFYVARKSGIKVQEFGIGLPPRIWGKKIKGTIYSVNWIPFGGFVRLYGEDSFDPKVLKSPDSFAGKSLRKRIAVVVAGVFMNFLLAFVLLTIGFSMGIEPLIVNGEDVFKAINSNIIEIDQGAKIKSVKEGSDAFSLGIKENDIIVELNDVPLTDPRQLEILIEPTEEKEVSLTYIQDGVRKENQIQIDNDTNNFGIELYDVIYLPRVIINEVLQDSDSAQAGLMPGDVIVEMNNNPIYFVSEYQDLISRENSIEYEIVRDYEVITIPVSFESKQRVVITDVTLNGSAYKAGFQKGDRILQIEDQIIYIPEDAINMTKNNLDKELDYLIERNGQQLNLSVTPGEDGLIGVGLINMISYKNDQLSVYNSDYLTSVININDVQYPFHQAAYEAIKESGRLAVLTVGMFGNLVRSVISQFAIPEGVAGPVGIAQMTHVFVQEGLLALLRFAALLSLSLAVINILPFPALDGGRLLFLLVEAVRGKRIPPKWEAGIHTFGFLLLIGLIFLVTYSDIINIFS